MKILIKEKKSRWNVFQFLVDEKGKKYIKMFSADNYWTKHNGIFVDEFTEDTIPEPSDKNWKGFQPEDITFIKAEFNDKDNWIMERKEEDERDKV